MHPGSAGSARWLSTKCPSATQPSAARPIPWVGKGSRQARPPPHKGQLHSAVKIFPQCARSHGFQTLDRMWLVWPGPPPPDQGMSHSTGGVQGGGPTSMLSGASVSQSPASPGLGDLLPRWQPSGVNVSILTRPPAKVGSGPPREPWPREQHPSSPVNPEAGSHERAPSPGPRAPSWGPARGRPGQASRLAR